MNLGGLTSKAKHLTQSSVRRLRELVCGALITVGVDGPRRHRICQSEVVRPQTREPSVDKLIRIGMDTSKSVFQLHGVDLAEEPILRKKVRRRQLLEFFGRLDPTNVGMEPS